MMCSAEDSIRDFEELILQSESHGRLWHSLTHLGLSRLLAIVLCQHAK